jgi:hypothetical protein
VCAPAGNDMRVDQQIYMLNSPPSPEYALARVRNQSNTLLIRQSARMHMVHMHCIQLRATTMFLLAPFRVRASRFVRQASCSVQTTIIEACTDCTLLIGCVSSTLHVRNVTNCTIISVCVGAQSLTHLASYAHVYCSSTARMCVYMYVHVTDH